MDSPGIVTAYTGQMYLCLLVYGFPNKNLSQQATQEQGLCLVANVPSVLPRSLFITCLSWRASERWTPGLLPFYLICAALCHSCRFHWHSAVSSADLSPCPASPLRPEPAQTLSTPGTAPLRTGTAYPFLSEEMTAVAQQL